MSAAVIACGVFVSWVALVCLIGPEDARRRLVRVPLALRLAWAMQAFTAALANLTVTANAAAEQIRRALPLFR